MGTENANTGKGEVFSFPGSDRNVYAEYLHVTFIRRMRLGWFFGALLFAAVGGFCIFYLANGGDIYSDNPNYRPGPYSRFVRAMAPFVAPFCAVVLPVLALWILATLTTFGCKAFGYAWPRFYSRQCAKSAKPRYRDYGRAYFDSFERHPARAVVGERSVRVTEPDGGKWTMALKDVRRAYRGNGLVVLETGERLPSAKTVILDVSGMGRAERRRFYRILDGRLPLGDRCRTFYLRLAGPPPVEAVREADPDAPSDPEGIEAPPPVAGSAEFAFPGSSENVYARFACATFFRRVGPALVAAGGLLLFAAWSCAGAAAAALPEGGPPAAAVPVAAACLCLAASLAALAPLTEAGCRFKRLLLPRACGRVLARSAGRRLAGAFESYFAVLERRPMRAVVDGGTVRVEEPGGGRWEIALRNVRRAYRACGLVVLETGEGLPPARTVILDESGMAREERRRFRRFLDKRLPLDSCCKTYYMRTTGPAVGEVVPDGEAADGRKAPGAPAEPQEVTKGMEERYMAKEASERELLPLGSVVELEGRGRRPFMVYGRMVEDEDGRTWDYLVCAHPEGHMPFGDLPEHWFANREHVSKLLFVGYQGGREAEFLEYQRNNVDGSLVWDM